MRAELVKLQKEYLIEMEDVVVVTNDKGKVKLHQAVNLTAAGAVGGTFWGMLIGMIFLTRWWELRLVPGPERCPVSCVISVSAIIS